VSLWTFGVSIAKQIVPQSVQTRLRGRRYGYRPAGVQIAHRIVAEADDRFTVFIDRLPALSVDADTGAILRFQLSENGQAVEEFHAFLRASRDPGGVLLDVGAHGGAFALPFCLARPENRVVAVEAEPSMVSRLKVNAERSGVADRIIPVTAFVGSGQGSIAGETDASGFFSAATGGGISVPIVAIDQLRERFGGPITILKVDVEGAEGDVLSSAGRTLAEDRPIVFLEVHRGLMLKQGKEPAEALRPLVDAGYVFTEPLGRVRSARWAASPRHAILRLVALPAETRRVR
jgi:FkbM family methyltransferase